MTTEEQIWTLRYWADTMTKSGMRKLVNEAADRLEELEERVAIMSENEVQVTMNDILRGGA